MTKLYTPNTNDFSFEKLITHSDFMDKVQGKVFYVHLDDSSFIPVTADDTYPDGSLKSAVTGVDHEGNRVVFLPFEGEFGIKLTARNGDSYISYMEQYKTKLKNMNKVPEFKSGITITVSKELVEKIKPTLKRMETKTLTARSYLDNKLVSIDPNRKDEIKHQTKGAVRSSETDQSYKIKIDGEFVVRVVNFAEVVLDEATRIATGLFSLFNFKAMEALFDSQIAKIVKRDDELK